ncbi:MAG TPA: methyltransferase domain-containing protein [Kiritimatiellia bacterium]
MKTWPNAVASSAAAGYVTCSSCGLVYDATPRDEAGHAAFHANQYAGDETQLIPDRLHKLDPEHARRRQFSVAYQEWARDLLGELRDMLPPERRAGTRFVDVGCASGGVVKAARDAGMVAAGTEVSVEAATYGIEREGLDLRIGMLEDLNLPEASFDIVFLHDVIEHVPSPMNLLKSCARILAPGGVICVHTVNVDSWTAATAKDKFFLADTTGGHTVLFSPATLRRYNTSAGLETVSVTTRGFRIVQRERDRDKMRGFKRAAIRLAENIGHELVKPLGKGHFVMVIGRKGS